MTARSRGQLATGLALLGSAAGLFVSGVGGNDAAMARSATVQPVAPPVVTPSAPAPVADRVPVFDAVVVARYPHDSGAFTQGLTWHGGQLYESVGQLGRSEVRRVNLADGRVLARAAIPPTQFGEGLAAHGRDLISLTWRNGVAHRWRPGSLRHRGTMSYPGEGWGLASDGARLILSDGTPTLRFLDPATLAERGRVGVTIGGRPLPDLNELEWVDGALWAHVWHQPVVVRIDPATGAVTGVIDLSGIVKEVGATDPEAVANGLAWNAGPKRLFVTGKLWPTLFEIRLAPRR